ncbi:hypothetical protein MRS44_009537 [Fusarium solani]|uniref:uncharacterized protein n=1 Tax=Fusarium solani TaxID=169388 RepID=UPI0032C43FEE|nr:hypothetical protein MRS44_009537 [Fusarium solani]
MLVMRPPPPEKHRGFAANQHNHHVPHLSGGGNSEVAIAFDFPSDIFPGPLQGYHRALAVHHAALGTVALKDLFSPGPREILAKWNAELP